MIVSDNLKYYGYLFILFFIVIFCIYFLINRSSYVNIPDFCKIQIKDDIVRGNKQTILQAIDLLKQEDRESYVTLCKYTNTIRESYCFTSINDDNTIPYSAELGCFIKGSKIINIIPEKQSSENIIKQRAESLKKYAKFSKDFWDNLKQ